ncbi:exodeoxyribonuclease VII small subunit [Pusillimonas sp.]|uniref:exodeoxyribonuclease VII small subunit n=1 Tax=Pusillimonas sp. TaxID=3040095 RepID=UPI0029BD8C43|nr:exodeoxyribonuclease VII small subunit [Pusillimonas sp.]MDX3894321.1 exodeoxyribonuclease VII small subunit [Pusillimonas sp.]
MVDHSRTPGDAQQAGSAAGSEAPGDLPQDFESALAQLEALVSQMENGSLPLDQSLAAYQKGVELARICQKLLDTAEQQVKVLQGNLLRPLDEAEGGSRGEC